jgi:hypothetical protein
MPETLQPGLAARGGHDSETSARSNVKGWWVVHGTAEWEKAQAKLQKAWAEEAKSRGRVRAAQEKLLKAAMTFVRAAKEARKRENCLRRARRDKKEVLRQIKMRAAPLAQNGRPSADENGEG